jgi:hypothetical protein
MFMHMNLWCIVRDAHDMYMMRCMHNDAHVDAHDEVHIV